jgi:hypothetical protein
MDGLYLPSEWFVPGEPATRAAAAIAEGFCPYPQCGYPFDEGRTCPVCEVTWELTPSGFSAEAGGTKVTAYPFAPWRQPVIDLGQPGG